jgi:FKBP-type peptidyl-prolyl cis-trans isomerase
MPYFVRMLSALMFLFFAPYSLACGSDGHAVATSVPQSTTTTTALNTTAASQTAVTAPPGGFFDMEHATTTASGLKYVDTVVGTGDAPRSNQSVVVNYTGKLASDGKVFDSSIGRGPATFGINQVIKGFGEGILTMKPGGKRTVYIPAALAYGASPPPGSGIPPNADLIFDIELISIK